MAGQAVNTRLNPALRVIGKNVRAWREKRGMSQLTAEEKSGVSVTTIIRLEAGKRNVRVSVLVELAKTYGVRLDQIITGEGL